MQKKNLILALSITISGISSLESMNKINCTKTFMQKQHTIQDANILKPGYLTIVPANSVRNLIYHDSWEEITTGRYYLYRNYSMDDFILVFVQKPTGCFDHLDPYKTWAYTPDGKRTFETDSSFLVQLPEELVIKRISTHDYKEANRHFSE